ncbi:hypothetical protein ALMP_47500 [Streptomyces sp. A012304]|nr:hypothetical protein ALMP_47500 [Streptomyces sp. A012304]
MFRTLGMALIGVVGLAKGVSPTIESGVEAAGLRHAVVGVIIALLVLLPETIAALRSARRDRLALGSAMASIGLTIPAVALASVWLSGPLVLGLGAIHMVLLAPTVVVSSLTVVPGRGTPLQGGVHLVLLRPTWNWRSTRSAAPATHRRLTPPPPPSHPTAASGTATPVGRVSGSRAKQPRLRRAMPVR